MGALDRVFRGRRGGQVRPLAAQVAALFANGEQGLWYDIEAFRDAWNNVGPELLPEGTFDSPSGWVLGAGWSISGGRASINNTSGSLSRLNRNFYPPLGKWYLVTVVVTSFTSGSFTVVNGGGTAAITKAGTFTLPLYRSDFYGLYIDAPNGTVAEIESISIKEWTGLANCALYQDVYGSTPAYLPGQGQVDPPVGLLIDRRAGLSRGAELFDDSRALFVGTSSRVSPGVYRVYSGDGSYSVVNFNFPPGYGAGWYEVSFNVDSVTVAGAGITVEGVTFQQIVATTGRKTFIVLASGTYVGIKRSSNAVDYQVSGVSIKPLKGNHAYQTTTASRPTLSARYNLLTYTDDFSNVIWGAPTNFSATAGEPAPDGSPTAFKITSLSGAAATSQTVIAHPVGPIKFVIWMKAGTATSPTVLVRNNTAATALISMGYGSTTASTSYGTGFVTDMGGGWKKFTIVLTSGISAGDSVGYYYGATGAIPVGQYWWVWRPDVRQSNDGVGLPEYQRVNTASTYDVDGFPLYLKFDGVDDFLQTGNGDFTGLYAVSVFASCRKLNDAAQGMLVEASTAYTTGPDGRFALLAPAVGDTYGARYAAGADVANLNALAVASPNSSVLSMIVDANNATPANRLSIRRNGSGSGMQTNSTLAAPAAMGNWPIYIGRRAGASLPFNGRLYGLLIRAGAINDGQIQKVERFLNQKAKVF